MESDQTPTEKPRNWRQTPRQTTWTRSDVAASIAGVVAGVVVVDDVVVVLFVVVFLYHVVVVVVV